LRSCEWGHINLAQPILIIEPTGLQLTIVAACAVLVVGSTLM